MAPHLTRLVGLWIVAGGVLKLLLGSSGDLPRAILDLISDNTLAFQLVVAVELAVGTLAFLRPTVGWAPAMLLLVVFLSVLGMQLAAGVASCGCFGAELQVSPALMLGVDGVLLGLMLMARPWATEAPVRAQVPLIAAVALALATMALPFLMGQAVDTQADPSQGDVHIERWPGMTVGDLPIAYALGEHASMQDGLIVIYSDTCPVCADHLQDDVDLYFGRIPNASAMVLLKLPDDGLGNEAAVHHLPQGPWVHVIELAPNTAWWITPPVQVEVRGGKVTTVLSGEELGRHD